MDTPHTALEKTILSRLAYGGVTTLSERAEQKPTEGNVQPCGVDKLTSMIGGATQRTVVEALESLEAHNKVRAVDYGGTQWRITREGIDTVAQRCSEDVA